MTAAQTPDFEPPWLERLRGALVTATRTHRKQVSCRADDLRWAIGTLQDGPGGDALIGHSADGLVIIDWQRLLKAAYFTAEEAEAFAGALMTHAKGARRRRAPAAAVGARA